MSVAVIDQIGGWWSELSFAKQLFFGIGLLSGIMVVILAILSFIGMEHVDAADTLGSVDLGHGGGGLFSVKPLTGFFLGFGWGGGIAMDAGWSLLAALATAFLAGGLIMGVVVLLFRAIYAMRSDGTAQINMAVGAIGTVYVTLPPLKASGGQVTVSFSGRRETFAALCDSATAIKSGEKIRVISVLDSRTVLVEPV